VLTGFYNGVGMAHAALGLATGCYAVPVRRAQRPVLLLVTCVLLAFPVTAEDAPLETSSPWTFQLYFDGGYVASSTEPANGIWRSKGTTFELDSPQVNLAMGVASKTATQTSRWGMEFGLQTGVDTEGLVTSPPPPAEEPVSNADALRHLYRANFSYLFSAKHGIRVTGGLLNSYIGYESYLAIENINYTRGYLTDNVPYFLVGVKTTCSPSDAVDLGFYVVTGFNYLSNPNDDPAYGFRLAWQVSQRLSLQQNIYYGPDQADTSLEFWRFLSDTIVEWKTERFLLAAAIDFGTEKQAVDPGQPRADWLSGALWARWLIGERWSIGLRPEFFRDDHGLMTGGEQTLRAYTATLKYEVQPARHNRLVATLEIRTDRSTGDGGGFYEGPENELVGNQNLVLLGLLWSFDR